MLGEFILDFFLSCFLLVYDQDFNKATDPSTVAPPPIQPKDQSEGEKMTSELMTIISQFGDKVK